jgi:glycosyltransferase involved in cell wall biosynthesis
VIVGGKGWFYESLETSVQAMGLSSRVRFAGYVLDADLPVWYSAATLFVYPSLYEGFGLPPLEAMACGTPVLVSDRSSLPEVVGEAGLSLPPDDAQAWADAIALLLGSPDRRQAMTEAGLEQAARFSWSQTARQTAEVYRQVLDND